MNIHKKFITDLRSLLMPMDDTADTKAVGDEHMTADVGKPSVFFSGYETTGLERIIVESSNLSSAPRTIRFDNISFDADTIVDKEGKTFKICRESEVLTNGN